MKATTNIFCLLIFAATGGCKKDALDVNTELEGFWQYDATSYKKQHFNITKGKSTYHTTYPPNTKDYTGKAKIKDNVLYIGKSGGTINSYPQYDTTNGNNFIIVGGKTFIKN